jgi:hypothetical protein
MRCLLQRRPDRRRKNIKCQYVTNVPTFASKADGSTSVQYFKLEDGAVMLEADVRRYFPDSESVNKALRSLIEIMSRGRS